MNSPPEKQAKSSQDEYGSKSSQDEYGSITESPEPSLLVQSKERSTSWYKAHAGEDAVDSFVGNNEMSDLIPEALRQPVLNIHATNQFRISLLGLPSSGKSSVFNILTSLTDQEMSPVEVSLFTTTDILMRSFAIPDDRLEYLAKASLSKAVIPQTMSCLDNPAIVSGSHCSIALGNSFLSKSRTADVVVYVIRAFIDEGITHYDELVDPVRDLVTIEQECMLRDLQTLESVLDDFERFALRHDATKERTFELETMIKIWEALTDRPRPRFGEKPKEGEDRLRWRRVCGGTPLRYMKWTAEETALIHKLDLLTAKEVLILLNMSTRDYLRNQNQWTPQIEEYFSIPHPKHGPTKLYEEYNEYGDKIEPPPKYTGGGVIVPFSVAFENYLRSLKSRGGECIEKYFLRNPTHESGVLNFISSVYKAINMIKYYVANEVETRAWSLPEGSSIMSAAKVISTDMEKLFNYADVVAFADFIENDGDLDVLRADRKLRPQGKKYILCDGDVIDIKVDETKLKQFA